jgi:hypothetical protein
MSEFGRTVCVPHSEVTSIARDVYYGIKILKALRDIRITPPP